MRNYSTPPSDDEIVDAFSRFASARAEAGVMVAKAISDVRFGDGRVTVVLDPAKSGAEYWALIETSAFDNLAELFGIPAAFDDEDGTWLRGRVSTVEVRDVDGRPLGTRTTAELNDKATGRGPAGA
ncbi:MAG: hypothetical protein QM774_06850 [Gordonia sp. (in: high G+C Gram-positive bacteria)]|uniref:hypothetical protein n=1 Tax=Gordonia sp. (in: high G+C Gram-positive bacteria) TaxID=84139 RepID=UPI0039E2D1FE